MKRLKFLAVLGFAVSSFTAKAEEQVLEQNLQTEQMDAPMEGLVDSDSFVHNWEFLGCFQNNQQCHHHAHEDGFLNHKTVFEHHRCGHHALACYGR